MENLGEMGSRKLHGESRPRLGLPKKRTAAGTTKKRHFKGFSQLIEDVDVDVFRSLDPVQFVPRGGANSFFQEELVRWRELNTAADFNSLFISTVRLVHSLPQLLFHKEKIIKALFSRIQYDAILSLEPVCSLIGSLARDLQGDFLPYFPAFVKACSDFIDTGGDREPEALQHLFTGMALVFKHLLRFLVADIVQTLKVVKRLRYHRRDYVRRFMAEGTAFLLRNAPIKQLVKGVRRMFSDVFSEPEEERIDGCAVTLFIAIQGAAGGLHSRAEGIIRLVLDPSILSGGKGGDGKGDRSQVAVKVVEVIFEKVCGQIKRDKIGVVWDVLVDELQQLIAEDKLEDLKTQRRTQNEENSSQAEEDGSKGKAEDARKMPSWVPQAARLVHLVNIMLAYHRGSRVKDYGPLFKLGGDLLRPELFMLSHELCNESEERIMRDLRGETLRLLLLLVQSHLQVAGASIGPTAVAKVAPSWALAFDCPDAESLFDFIEGLLECNIQVVHPFSRAILSALDRLVATHQMRTLPLLVDICQTLEPSPCRPPLLRSRTAVGCSNLVPHVRKVLAEWVEEEGDGSKQEDFPGTMMMDDKAEGNIPLQRPSASLVWHCLQCLPYTCLEAEEGEASAMEVARHAQRRLEGVYSIPSSIAQTHPWQREATVKTTTNMIQEKFHLEGLLATALSTHTCLLKLHRPTALKSHLETYVQYAMQHCRSHLVLTSVADFLDGLSGNEEIEGNADDTIIARSRAQELLDVLQPNLSRPEQSLRFASIRILCHLPSAGVTASEATEQRLTKRVKKNGIDGDVKDEEKPSKLFEVLRSIEGEEMLLETYRHHVVSINHLKMMATTGKLPQEYISALTGAMIGALHIPFALIWGAASECICALLDQHRNIACPLFIEQLQDVQNEFIRRVFGQSGGQQMGRWSRIGTRAPRRNDDEGNSDEGDKPASVEERFELSLIRDETATNDATLLGLLLKCLLKAIPIVEARSRQLMPLFFAFVGHEPSKIHAERRGKKSTAGKRVRQEGAEDGEAEDETAVLLAIGPQQGGGKQWRAAVRDWLKLLAEVKNAQSLYGAPLLKNIVTDRFLPDKDPGLQSLSLRILLNWKEGFLVPYAEHLENLISFKTLREELTTWSISKEKGYVLDEHRPGLLPILMRILLPKLKRRRGKISGRAYAGVHRGSVLTFLAQVESDELWHLMCLVFGPMNPAFRHPNKDTEASNEKSEDRWQDMMSRKEGAGPDFIQWIDSEVLASSVAQRRKVGVLHIVLDLLKCFSSDLIWQFLHPILAVVFKLLQEATQMDNNNEAGGANAEEEDDEGDDEDEADDDETADREAEEKEEGANHPKNRQRASKAAKKDIRVLSLRVLTFVLEKYPNLNFNPLYWDILFAATNRSIQCLKNESVSSTVPGAFLSCLVAISTSRNLVHLLARDTDLIPNLASILSCRGASPSVISEVLRVVENVLDMEENEEEEGEMNCRDEEKPVQKVLLPHLKSLLENLRELLSMQRVKVRGKKGTLPVKRELRILVRVSIYVNDREAAEKLVEVLLPFLRVRKRMDEDAVANVVQVIGRLNRCLPSPSLQRCILAYGRLLVSISSQMARSCISSSIQALASVEPNLQLPAELLAGLNAMSSGEIDEIDYDRRLAVYAQLVPTLFATMNCQQARLILGQCIHDLYSEDMSLRHSASEALVQFVRFAAGLPEEDAHMVDRDCEKTEADHDADNEDEEDNDDEKTEHNASNHVDQRAEEESAQDEEKGGLRSLVHKVIWTLVKTGLRAEDMPIRREFVILWKEIAELFQSHPKSQEFSCLLHQDVEVDFFHNIVHLQVHRRIRAMAKFRTACAAGAFPTETLVQVFVPLFQHSLFEGKGPKDGNLPEGAVTTLACIASQLPWDAYYPLLMRMFRLIPSKPAHQKLLVRVMCRFLDEFHFFEGEEDMNGSNLGTTKNSEKLEAGEPHEARETNELTQVSKIQLTSEEAAAAPKRRVSQTVLTALLSRVYPALYKFLISEMDIVNAPVALAIVKVLLLMPSQTINVEMPRVLQGIANVLKSRLQSVRDEARSTLVAVVECLGPSYFHFLLDVLRSTLLRGYQLHVLGYTLHAILLKLSPKVQVGDLDYCIEGITEVLIGDIMGEVGEEKEVDAVADKMKETRHMQSFESFRLLAQVVSFREHAVDLLHPVQDNLSRSLDPKIRKKIEMILHHVSIGLHLNPSMSSEALLVFVHAVVESGLQDEKDAADAAAVRKKARSLVDSLVTARATDDGDSADAKKKSTALLPNAHLIMEFALQLMFSASKKEKFNVQDETILSMLDGMIKLLAQCLSSRNDGLVALAIKNLCFVLVLPVPSAEVHADDIKSRVMEILAGMGRTTSLLAQSCFKLLTVLIRRCKACNVSQEELRALLSSPLFSDLEENTTRNTIFSLVQAIVARRIIVPEVYDLMDRVAELMISTQAKPVRELCGHTFLHFLLFYPLGKKRLEQHLQFIVQNLGYEHQHGREAALEMLHSVLAKFPEPLVESSVDLFYVPLVTRLVNDEVSHCRAMTGTVLKELLGRVKISTQERLVDFAFTWYTGDKTSLWRPAAQVIGIASESMGKNFQKYAYQFLDPARTMIERMMQAMSSDAKEKAGDKGGEGDGHGGGGGPVWESKDEEDDPTAPYWQEGYFTLTTLEKILQKFPKMILQPQMQGIWHLISELLLHRHQWVQKVSARLVGVYLAACEVPTKESMAKLADAEGDEARSLLHPSWIFLLAARVCRQIGSPMIDEALGSQAVKNLVYIAAVLPLLEVVDIAEADSRATPLLKGCDEAEAKDHVDHAWRLLGMARQRRTKEKPTIAEGKDTTGKSGSTSSEEDHESGSGEEEEEEEQEMAGVDAKKKGRRPSKQDNLSNKSVSKSTGSDLKADGKHSILLGAVFQLMSRIALRTLPVQAALVMRWFAAITTMIGQESIRPYLPTMLLPLYRISEGLAGRTITDEMKELAEEVLGHIRSVVGVSEFVTIYNSVRQSVKVRRDKRKQVQAIEKLVAPEAAARRKIKLGVKKQERKKRKIDEHRRHRAGHRMVNQGQRRGQDL